MTEIRTSDFKMFEKAPYEEPNSKDWTNLVISTAMKQEETIYGPVFTTMFIENALEYVEKKFGEKTSEDIKTLDQIAEYLCSIADKHPTAYKTIIYANWKAEYELQGQSGAGHKLAVLGFAKGVKKESDKKIEIDVDDAITKYRQFTLDVKVAAHELGYKKNEDGSADIFWPNCYMQDACKTVFDKGWLTRPDGKTQCTQSPFLCQFLKLTTGYEWDYTILERFKPHCLARVYMV